MRSFFTALLAVSAALPAYADTDPGRVRSGSMDATHATGFYRPAQHVPFAVTYGEDGAPESITLSVPGRRLTAHVWRRQASPCDDHVYAHLELPMVSTETNVELADYEGMRCRLYLKHKWHAVVDTAEPDGTLSHLELEGDPR